MQKEKTESLSARIPASLYNWLKDRAASNLRSVNNEIILILKEHKQKEEK